jgi:hypothetical protein
MDVPFISTYFICNYPDCRVVSSVAQDLVVHQKLHPDVPFTYDCKHVYMCVKPNCLEVFDSMYSYNLHLINSNCRGLGLVHQEPVVDKKKKKAKKRYACLRCTKTYSTSGSLTRHEEISH